MSAVIFQMWEPMRRDWLAEHRFYVKQARKRLLTQFDNIEVEADNEAEAHLGRLSKLFDPDRHDVSDLYEAADDKGNEFYRLLSDMRDRTRLSVIAGMYHEWDKKLREWITQEACHWSPGDNVAKAIWKADISSVIDLLHAFNFYVRSLAGYRRLDAMRLVVNVFKHGDGKSLDDLKEKYAEFIPGSMDYPVGWSQYLDHTHMEVTEKHLDEFSEAIIEFWQAVPERICVDQNEVEVPTWFEKAFLKDRASHEGA